MKRFLKRCRGKDFIRGTKAVSALEYAILVGVVAVAVGAALTTFGTDITTALTTISGNISTNNPGMGTP